MVFEVGEDLVLLLCDRFLNEQVLQAQGGLFNSGSRHRQLQHRNPGQALVRFSPGRRWADASAHNLHRFATARAAQSRSRLHPGLHRAGNNSQRQMQQRN
jgi:hypothetical protein